MKHGSLVATWPLFVSAVAILLACEETPAPATPAAGRMVAQTPLPPPGPTDAPTPNGPTAGVSAQVTGVVDGDTVDVVFENGSTDRERLLGVVTPETYSSNKPLEYGSITNTACLDSWGDRATEFATEELGGQTVTLVMDPQAGARGSFGRLLAYIDVGTRDFNRALVEESLARVYTEGDSSREEEYLALEEDARALGLGLWKCERGGRAPVPVHDTWPPQPQTACDPAYPTICIPPRPPDLDCGDIPHRRFTVLPPDPHRLVSSRQIQRKLQARPNAEVVSFRRRRVHSGLLQKLNHHGY